MGDEKTIDNVLAMHAQAVEMIRWRDAEIAALKTNLDAWQSTGNAIMLCAVGREAPLSDSDVCGEINALRQQVAELEDALSKRADSQSDVAQLLTTVEQQRQYIERLHQQVAELQATVKKLQAEIHAADIRGVLDWTS